MRTRWVLGFFVLLLPALAAQASEDTRKVAELQHVLEVTAYVPNFKRGISEVVQKTGQSNPVLKEILAADNETLLRVFARVYARHMSAMEVDEVARFYGSPTGKALLTVQRRDPDNPHPALQLTATQRGELQSFSHSAAAKAFMSTVRDKDVWGEALREIRAALSH